MLKSFPHPRQSPIASPRYHYAPVSRSTPSSPSSRRASKSASQHARFPPPRALNPVQYVDAGTQWSPIMNVRKDSDHQGSADDDEETARVGVVVEQPQEDSALVASGTVTAPPPEPVLEGESPGIKRRQSRIDSSSTTTTQALPTKRVKSDATEVKILPAKYEYCEVEDIVVLIANMIGELISTNDSLPLRTGVLTRFHSRTPPGISVLDYLQRLAKHATLTPPLLLAMVYYIDRLCLLYPAFTINTLTVHRFLITAATVAAKGLSDSFWNNATYARVGGIKIAELGLLELDFLYRVDWKIVPNPETLEDYYRGLVERAAGYEIDGGGSPSSDDDDESEQSEESDGQIGGQDGTAQPDGLSTGLSELTTDTKVHEWVDGVTSKEAQDDKGATKRP